jgi:hypothetical protein
MIGQSQEPAAYGAVNYDPWGKPRVGDWIQTRSGVKLHLLDTRPEDFRIEDIAHALSNMCRFTGHTKKFYSVAEHSVRVCRRIMQTHSGLDTSVYQYGEACMNVRYGLFTGRDVAFAGLMHDASEAYLADIARPFKHLPEFEWYRKIEDKLMREIALAFDFQYPLNPVVKTADEILLGTEARDLMAPVIDGWHFRYEHLPERIRPWSPRKAKREFLKLFYQLNRTGVTKPRRSFFGLKFAKGA